VAKPEIVTRGFVHGNEHDPLMEGAVDRMMAAIEGKAIGPASRSAQEPDQGRDLTLSVRADAPAPLVFPVVVEV